MKNVKNWKYLLFEIFILLLMKVSNIQSGCTWNSQNYCTISCTSSYSYSGSETISQNMAQLEEKWNERSDCHDEGINLELEDLRYPDFVVKAYWFTANVKVKEMQFYGRDATVMEVDSLMANAFKTVKKLVMTSTSLSTFNKGLFNGLESLEILNIKGVSYTRTKIIEKDVLDTLNQTLKEFTFEQLAKNSNEIVIDGFTGSEMLPRLTYVKYAYNLESSITRNSFVGLKNVKTLDLSDCQIVTIGAGAFDRIESIEVLKLENNAITFLPYGLFDPMLPSYTTYIYLEGNRKWICECDLMPFKMILIEHFNNFIGAIECNLPQKLRSAKVNETDFCDTYVPPVTTAPTTVSSTSTVTSPTTTISTETTTFHQPLPDEFPQACFEPGETDEVSKIVTIKTPSQSLSINENENGDIVLELDMPMENRVLIWFSLDDRATYFSADNEINCLIASGTSIPLTKLMEKPTSAYTFCLMNSIENTVSPLDCISHAQRDNYHEKPWLYESSKSFVISMISIACCLSVLIGVAFGYFTMIATTNGKENLNSAFGNIGIAVALKEAVNSSSIMKKQNRLSDITDDSFITKSTTNTTLPYYVSDNYNAPPLPVRPSSMYPFEEPIYATVGDHK